MFRLISTQIKLFLPLTIALTSLDSHAHYYEEHKLISQLALQLAVDNKMLDISNTGIRTGLNSKFLCEKLLDSKPKNCITLADLPALSGDHAGSPMLMQWRWFNDNRDPGLTVKFEDYIASARIIADRGCQSSETTNSKIPNREGFFKVMHRSPDAMSFGETSEVTSNDPSYVRSAAHNCNHFRDPRELSSEQYKLEVTGSYSTDIWTTRFFLPNFASKFLTVLRANERVRFKPKLEAGAWYAQLHATALELASIDGPENLAAAWLFESFALHFLQDGTSAGHIVTPNNGGLSVLKTKKIHDKYSEKGIKVSIEQICKSLKEVYPQLKNEFVKLSKACNETNQTTTIFGDRNLVLSAEKTPSKDIAVFLTLVSLHEFGNAIKLKTPLMDEQKTATDYELDPHWTYQGQGNGKLAETMFAWWESGGKNNIQTSPMSEAAVKHIKAGNIAAFALWPKPVDD
jgi:hypothetical protein